MNPDNPRVAVVQTSHYPSLAEAIGEALHLLEVEKAILPAEAVLFKPNLLMKIKNACTQSDFLAGVAQFFKPLTPHLAIGDSPGQFRHRARSVMSFLGFDPVLEAENLAYAEFESGGIPVENPRARHMSSFHMAKPVLETDWLINLCRPKSHAEAVYTGAVKNYWGIIPGGEKARCHLYGQTPAQFGHVLVDNYQTLLDKKAKRLTVMDARQFMEGPAGPANGPMRDVGLILAGYDEVAVDLAMLAIAGLDGHKTVPHLGACRERGLGPSALKDIMVVGQPLDQVRLKRKIRLPSGLMSRAVSFVFGKIGYRIMRRRPALNENDCVKCGDCYHICPNQAISWEKHQLPVFDDRKCISCLCCVECCPQQALAAKAAGLSGLFQT